MDFSQQTGQTHERAFIDQLKGDLAAIRGLRQATDLTDDGLHIQFSVKFFVRSYVAETAAFQAQHYFWVWFGAQRRRIIDLRFRQTGGMRAADVLQDLTRPDL
jgi:hypothetical protein